MNMHRLLLAALAFAGSLLPVLAAAQSKPLTTAFFEENRVRPRDAARLRATILNRTISIRTLKDGAIEQVRYGAMRVDGRGEKTKYTIRDGGIEEQHGGVPRMLLIYDWHGHAYGCLEDVGDLDELGEAKGTCPFEIVATATDSHRGGK
jgi:hypothetical protein